MKQDEFDDPSVTANPVTVTGTAYNAKAGAVLEADDGRVIYIAGLEEWDTDVLEKSLQVTGILEKKSPFPSGKVPSGIQMQRMSGTTWVLQLTEPYKK